MSSAVPASPIYRPTPGPLHAILLGGSVTLFLGALLSDIAYYQTHQIQWSNFAAWLLAGAELFAGITLVFALVNLIRAKQKNGQPLIYVLALLVTWVLGLINCFQHAKDAWAVMPGGLILSVIGFILICITAWFGFGARTGGVK